MTGTSEADAGPSARDAARSSAFPTTAAGTAVGWWWRAVHAHGADVSPMDLDAHFSGELRGRSPHLGEIDEFRAYARTSILGSAELVNVIASGAQAVTVVFDSHGARFEMSVEVEPEPPHRITSYRLGLEGGASLTALSMLIVRAVHHRVHSEWRVLYDPYAEVLAGPLAERAIRQYGEATLADPIPINTPARHRYAEDRLIEALADGVDQYILLGAGLDTSALRHRSALVSARVFEVDHVRSQAWKLDRLASSGIANPANVTCVAVDLSSEPLTPTLVAHGFDPSRPSFVSWLGVTYYLTQSAVQQVLQTLASWAAGTHVVFDYFLPPEDWPKAMKEQGTDFAALGEPWITWWSDEGVDSLLRDCGLTPVELLTTSDIIERYAPNAPVVIDRDAVQHLAHAIVSDDS